LLSIILALVFELVVALTSLFGIDFKKDQPEIVTILSEERNAEKVRHFHNLPDEFKPTRGDKNACFYCHGDFPHSKEPMIRTLMNMHTQFTGCMTCHVDSKYIAEKDINLRWLNYSGIEVSGMPYGLGIDPESGELNQTDDFYSKIVAYDVSGKQEVLLEIGPGDLRLVEFLRVRESISDADKEALKKRFHKGVKSKGRKCSHCHIDEAKSYIPFRELGFSEQRIDDLTHLNLVGLIEKYKRFYISDLIGSGSGTQVNGKEASKNNNKKQEQMRQDPKTWWKKMYD
ncbi:MAG: hypothetical protein OEZ38_10995, partial [Gammaproteobacteria bacterium]|nr:hypothetical protein [Gammaproteobacteria bacterium]